VTREVLLTAIKDSILDTAELKVVYTPRGASDSRSPSGDGNPKKGSRK